LSCLLCSS
jgi:flotillin